MAMNRSNLILSTVATSAADYLLFGVEATARLGALRDEIIRSEAEDEVANQVGGG